MIITWKKVFLDNFRNNPKGKIDLVYDIVELIPLIPCRTKYFLDDIVSGSCKFSESRPL